MALQVRLSSATMMQTPVSGLATIGKSISINGEYVGEEDLYFDGELVGRLDLAASRLVIGPNGKVNASIRAGQVEILGVVEGNIEVTDKIVIRRHARLVGDAKTGAIVIEDGAYFRGSIDVSKRGCQTRTG